MTEYDLKRTYEHGSLDEVVGEIEVIKRVSKMSSSFATFSFGTLLTASFLGGFTGESIIDHSINKYGAITVPLGILYATMIPTGSYPYKEFMRITLLISALGAATAYYLNR